MSLESISLFTPDGHTELVKNARLQLAFGRHYGIIGRNGIGKSTLLRHIAEGTIPGFPNWLRVLHIAQEEVMGDERTALEYVLQSDEEKVWLEKEEQRLLDKLEAEERPDDGESDEDDDIAINNKLSIVSERLEDIGLSLRRSHPLHSSSLR